VRRAAVLVCSCALLAGGSLGCELFGRLTGRPRAGVDTVVLRKGLPPPAPSASAALPEVPDTTAIDRVVVRWFAPETGGVTKPQFVFARELSFEARLESLVDPDPDGATYRDRHVRAALDRHIAETLLAALPTAPEPKAPEIAQRAENARAILEQRAGAGDSAAGHDRVLDAAASEGISSDELDRMLRRQAKASLYLDRMVAPMLEPTETELLALHRTGQTPFSDKPFDDVKDRMKRWYVGARLAQALETYFQNARSRVTIVVIKKP
jgi:hypothetical protein